MNAFLQFNGKEILHNAGKISARVAQELAYKEYDKLKVKQDKLYKSDFDNFLNKTRMIENGSENNGGFRKNDINCLVKISASIMN